jgi:head-tail adaptor
MPLLTAAEITSMRSEQSGTLPDTGVVWRYTQASDAMGGQTETWAALATALCRLSPSPAGLERVTGERVTEIDQWTITFAQGTDVLARDKVKVGTRTFEVKSVSDHDEWETARRVHCVEVAG